MDSSNLPGAIGGAAGAVAAGFAAHWILTRVAPVVTPGEGGWRHLRYHKSYLVLGWIGALMFFSGMAGMLLSEQPPRVRLFSAGIYLLFGLEGLTLIAVQRRCFLAWDRDTLLYSPLLGAPFSFVWTDVAVVRYSGMNQWWRLKLHTGRTVRVSLYMHGALEFMMILARRGGLEIPSAFSSGGQRLEFDFNPETG